MTTKTWINLIFVLLWCALLLKGGPWWLTLMELCFLLLNFHSLITDWGTKEPTNER